MVKGPWHRVDYWRDKSIAGEGRWELLFLYPIMLSEERSGLFYIR